MSARTPLVLVAAWALIALAWAFANPPFAAPDEEAHYLRAVGVAGGTLTGDELTARPAAELTRREAWLAMNSREVVVPARLVPPDPGCYVLDPSRSAACLDVAPRASSAARMTTYVGDYQPLPYLLPAAGVRLGPAAVPALRWGRLAGLLPCLALLATAVALLWNHAAGPLSLLGLVAAVTPMVLFCAASLTGSGLEIAAGVAFVAALLRLRRDATRRAADRSPAWVWTAVAVSGTLLALSRPTSPVWVVLAIALGVAMIGPRLAWRLVRDRRAAWVAAAAVLGGLALSWAWDRLYGPDAVFGVANARGGLREGVRQFDDAAHQLVFAPAYLEFALPSWGSLLWLAIVVALVATALFAVRTARDRVVLVATALAVPLVPIALYLVTIRFTGASLQGRYLLPIVVALPLLAGELVSENRERLRAVVLRALIVAVPVAAATVHLLALWRNAQRSALGLHGSLLSWDAPEWTPPAGWALWFVVAAAGCALLGAPALPARSRRAAVRPRG
jgi:Predicted membrane protein (DUF2142)